jgi:F-type H+-transporting ATPase subunit b
MISVAQAAEKAHGAVEHAAPFWHAAEFWVALAFVIMVGMAFRPLARAIGAALDLRAAKIKARIEDAQKLHEDAKEALAAYQRKQRDALKEAESIVEHAKAEAERLALQSAKDTEEAIQRRSQQALDRIAQAEAQAIKEVRNIAIDIAIEAAERVVKENLSAAQAGALVDNAIQDLGSRLH